MGRKRGLPRIPYDPNFLGNGLKLIARPGGGSTTSALSGVVFSVFVAVALAEREFWRTGLMEVLFGEDANTVESDLQLRVILLVISIGGNWNGAADAHEGAAEGLRNHSPVPSLQNPGSVESDVKGHQRRARCSCQHYRARLGYVAGASRTVNRERDSVAVFQGAAHPDQRAHRTFGA